MSGEYFKYKIPIRNVFSPFEYDEHLLIAGANVEDYLSICYRKVTSTNRIICSSYVKDVNEISRIHDQLFKLLIRNVDAIKPGDYGIALDKQCFDAYILPHMKEIK